MYYETQLSEAIECVDKIAEIVGNEIGNWYDTIQVLNEVDEFDNPFQRIELGWMKRRVNSRYDMSLKEAKVLQETKETFEEVLKFLYVMDAFEK